MINLTNRHGTSVYEIQQTFLIEHVNLSDEIKQQLLSANDQPPTQMDTPNDNDQALNTQTPSQNTQATGGLDSTSDQARYSNETVTTHSPGHLPTQPTSQPDQTATDNTSDQERGDSHPDHSPSQTTGHFSAEGFRLLEKTLDQLSRQLDRKDDQITEKDVQLSKLDKQLSVERERNEKLTQIVEQGNVLVHSAQQRIPLPPKDTKGDSIESTIQPAEVIEDSDTEPASDEPTEPAENRGVISKLFSRFGRSDS
ncbi:MAG: hypothetical protein AAFN77_18315 [Planctomycetota bacterium]